MEIDNISQQQHCDDDSYLNYLMHRKQLMECFEEICSDLLQTSTDDNDAVEQNIQNKLVQTETRLSDYELYCTKLNELLFLFGNLPINQSTAPNLTEELDSKFATLQQKIALLNADYHISKSDILKWQKVNDEIKKELEDAKDSYRNLEKYSSKMQADLSILKDKLQLSETSNKNLQKFNSNLQLSNQSDTENLNLAIREFEVEFANLSRENKAIKVDVENLKSMNDNLVGQNKRLKKKVKRAKKKNKASDDNSNQSNCQELQNQCQDLNVKLQAAEKMNFLLRNDIDIERKHYETGRNEVKDKMIAFEYLKGQHEKLKEKQAETQKLLQISEYGKKQLQENLELKSQQWQHILRNESEQIVKLRQEVKMKNEEIETIRKEKNDIFIGVDSLNTQQQMVGEGNVIKEEWHIKDQKNEKSSRNEILSDKENEVNDLKSKNAQMCKINSLAVRRNEINTLNDKFTDVLKEKDNEIKRITNILQQKISNLAAMIEMQNREIEEKNQRIEYLQSEGIELQEEANAAESKISQQKISNLSAMIEMQNREIEEKNQLIEYLQSEGIELQEKANAAESKISLADQFAEGLQHHLSFKQQQFEELCSLSEQHEMENTNRAIEFQNQILILEQKLAECQDENEYMQQCRRRCVCQQQ